MVTPDTLPIWLKEQAWPLCAIAACLLLALLLLKVSARRRHEALSRQRESVTEASFTAHLVQFGFDAAIVSSTYRYLREVQLVQFPILPSDQLDHDLGLDSEDVEQTVRELTIALGRELNGGLIHTPLVTVEDLIRLLQASPRREQIAAA